MKNKILFTVLIIQLLICGFAFAQDPITPAKPAGNAETKPVPSEEAKIAPVQTEHLESLDVTITKVDGDAEVKKAGETTWTKAMPGLILKEGSFVSTGFKSQVVLLFADNSTVAVKQLTQLKISRFEKDKDAVKTNLRLRVGSVNVKVKENQPNKTDMKISTPNATASVRGTELQEVRASGHFGDSVAIASGKIDYGTKQGSMPVQGGESTNQNLINPVENLIMNTVVDLAPLGSTDLENMTMLLSSSSQGSLQSNKGTASSDPSLVKIVRQETLSLSHLHWYPYDGANFGY